MRIVLIGQAAFGERILQVLHDRREVVVGVLAPSDTPGWPDPLKELAVKLNIPVLQPARMRAPEVYAQYASFRPELNVMAFVTDIVPESILNHPELGTIQYHPSLLPKHRGGSAINWAVINGETRTGITIFWPDEGIDTGPVLLQKEAEISADDTVGSLYFNKLFPLGVEAIVESVELIKKGTAPRILQDEAQATYEGLCTEKDAVINWSQPVTQVYNLIRGTNPQPGAITYFQGQRFKVFDSELIPGTAGGLPGEVTGTNERGFTVAALDGAVLVKRVQVAGSPKIASPELMSQVNMKTGDQLDE